jgi:dihydrofolate reductase
MRLSKVHAMAKLRVHNFTISTDGYATGPNQREDAPFGDGNGGRLHEWLFATKTFGGALTGLDDEVIAQGDDNVGATVMGRNMFGPIRGEWPNHDWTGWWGPNPPYHHDVFVLTHYGRPSLPMEGGTTFHFVTDGLESALEQAFKAADGKDVRLGGGADVVRQCLRAGLIDSMHIVVVPLFLGAGERLFGDLPMDGYQVTRTVTTEAATHLWIERA